MHVYVLAAVNDAVDIDGRPVAAIQTYASVHATRAEAERVLAQKARDNTRQWQFGIAEVAVDTAGAH